ncbi:hypothetical protein [Microcella humidisoli]|uniref:Ig-like domain-containing protein n=1 Tax=Microcella humidisoli TaxID=2963406 RepID=A0ABY5FYP6_9MICO|nr:hypothetical protein [Microcella humidisoli]UTT63262.1 hypothetical protein NNL39_03930 [Microcella humidisoli]
MLSSGNRFDVVSVTLPAAGPYQVYVTASGGATATISTPRLPATPAFGCSLIGGGVIDAQSIEWNLWTAGAASSENWDYDYELTTTTAVLGTVVTAQPGSTITLECAPSPSVADLDDQWVDRLTASLISIAAVPVG